MMAGKWAATWHPRPCPPWVCVTCGKSFPTDGLCALHEPVCPLRPEEPR